MKPFALVFAAFTFFFPGISQAAEWRYLTQASDKTVISIDLSSVRTIPAKTGRQFPVVQLWIRWDYTYNKSEKARKALSMERVNCDGVASMTASMIKYSADGSVLDSMSQHDDYDFRYEPLAAETIGYAIYEFACGHRSI